MIISEDAFEVDFVRALDAALALDSAGWAEIHARHREIFDDVRNFRELRLLLSP